MSKLLLFAFLAFCAYLFYRSMGRGARRPRGERGAARPAEEMVACSRCGVHLPDGESLKSGSHRYCCEEHRVLGPRQPGA